MPQDFALVTAVLAVVMWLLSLAVAVLRGRDMISRISLDSLGSIEGRSIVLAIVNDKNARIEEKLDALAKAMDGLGRRIDSMSDRLQNQLTTLDSEARDLQVRMAVLEGKRSMSHEDR